MIERFHTIRIIFVRVPHKYVPSASSGVDCFRVNKENDGLPFGATFFAYHRFDRDQPIDRDAVLRRAHQSCD